jgi:type IV secretory pathway VirD2 relaxase
MASSNGARRRRPGFSFSIRIVFATTLNFFGDTLISPRHQQPPGTVAMANDRFDAKLGRIRGARREPTERYTARILREAGKQGFRALRRKGRISPASLTRGMGTGVRAAFGLIAPNARQVIVKARYTPMVGGNLGAAKTHLRYILRDGVTRECRPGRLYDATSENVDGAAFIERSANDPHLFRFVVSADDGAKLADLKPFIRDLIGQMQVDLDTKLDWVAVDHFNTGHPHTHIVIRGRDDQGRDLVMARDYIAHGVRARARSLITLELGPETELERIQKLVNEMGQERLTRLDRALLAHTKDGILVVTSALPPDPTQHTLRIGRLRTLERLGLAEERQAGVWALDPRTETKLRQLGERADKFKMMQRALKEAGIDRATSAMSLFDRGPRKTPLIGRLVGVGLVDEITDRTWAVIDAVDGRIHYAELGRLGDTVLPSPGALVALGGQSLHARPSSTPKLDVLSAVSLEQQIGYDGPTWLDQAIHLKWRPDAQAPGFVADVQAALAARGRWLEERDLAHVSPNGDINPCPNMTRTLRQLETERIVRDLSRQLNAAYIPSEPGGRISGIYELAITTPTGIVAVVRREDTFTLAPWKPQLEPFRGRAVMGMIGLNRVTWSLDRGKSLRGRP